MQLIADKVRVSFKNEVIAKQKRLTHEITVFDVQLLKFVEIIEAVSIGNILLFVSASGLDVSYSYIYQGNQFTYYLNSDQISEFREIAEQKNFKIIKHEI